MLKVVMDDTKEQDFYALNSIVEKDVCLERCVQSVAKIIQKDV